MGQEEEEGCKKGGKKIALRGGGRGDTEAHFPNPPPLGRRDGRGFRAGVPDLPCRGGGGGQPNIYGSK